MVTQGGVTLEWHSSNPETLSALTKQTWDYVILQEQSLRPVKNRTLMHQYAEILFQKIRAVRAQTLLYLTWARQHQPDMIHDLSDSYVTLGEKLNVQVVPAGLAWATALAKSPDLILHTEDQSHPTPTGTYLAACVFYATLFNASPEGATGTLTIEGENVLDLSESNARLLQSIAWETVKDFSSYSPK